MVRKARLRRRVYRAGCPADPEHHRCRQPSAGCEGRSRVTMPAAAVDSPRAWTMAVGCALANGVAFGTLYTFGAFVQSMADEFDAGLGPTSVVFGITMFLFFGTGALSGRWSDRYGPRPLLAIGGLLFCAGLIATSYVNAIWQGYLVYGIGAGFGGGLFSAPLFAALAAWFVKYRAVAQGVGATGPGLRDPSSGAFRQVAHRDPGLAGELSDSGRDLRCGLRDRSHDGRSSSRHRQGRCQRTPTSRRANPVLQAAGHRQLPDVCRPDRRVRVRHHVRRSRRDQLLSRRLAGGDNRSVEHPRPPRADRSGRASRIGTAPPDLLRGSAVRLSGLDIRGRPVRDAGALRLPARRVLRGAMSR